jgi:hypothetical protein
MLHWHRGAFSYFRSGGWINIWGGGGGGGAHPPRKSVPAMTYWYAHFIETNKWPGWGNSPAFSRGTTLSSTSSFFWCCKWRSSNNDGPYGETWSRTRTTKQPESTSLVQMWFMCLYANSGREQMLHTNSSAMFEYKPTFYSTCFGWQCVGFGNALQGGHVDDVTSS